MEELLNIKYCVNSEDYLKGGEGASELKRSLQQIGICNKVIKRACVACYEAEMNLVIHSLGGYVAIRIYESKIRIEVIDRGPGIEDIEKAMKEGYSTASEEARNMGFGAGMGLPNMKRNSDFFELNSEKGKGTEIIMEILF